jgi:DNA primase
MDLAALIGRLEGVHRTSGGYLARCPAHEDHNASLSIAQGDDSRILLHCWAGCETAAVVRALGLSFSDLFPARERVPRDARSGRRSWRRA